MPEAVLAMTLRFTRSQPAMGLGGTVAGPPPRPSLSESALVAAPRRAFREPLSLRSVPRDSEWRRWRRAPGVTGGRPPEIGRTPLSADCTGGALALRCLGTAGVANSGSGGKRSDDDSAAAGCESSSAVLSDAPPPTELLLDALDRRDVRPLATPAPCRRGVRNTTGAAAAVRSDRGGSAAVAGEGPVGSPAGRVERSVSTLDWRQWRPLLDMGLMTSSPSVDLATGDGWALRLLMLHDGPSSNDGCVPLAEPGPGGRMSVQMYGRECVGLTKKVA